MQGNTNNKTKFKTKNWVEVNNDAHEIKFKTTMFWSSLCDYSDVYILVKGTIRITGAGNNDTAQRADERNKQVTFKNCAPLTKCKYIKFMKMDSIQMMLPLRKTPELYDIIIVVVAILLMAANTIRKFS